MKKPIPFGKYYLLDRISVGGMAEVFKAKAFGVEGFERVIAVKRILPSISEDKEFITMFIDEAKIAVQLQHANIAQIFDLGKVDDSYFIALEYVPGKDLRSVFDALRKKGKTIPVPAAAYVIMKVCEGLDYAHNKKDAAGRELNLVHRDVSPQNILTSYDGDVKIIDFGIAKATGKAGKTQAGILKGKFSYMSPEQVRGLPLDRRSDLFAVGICLWELVTGERLFVGESDFATLEKVRKVEVPEPSKLNPEVTPEFERIIMKALSREVEERYQGAMEFHDDLQNWMYQSKNLFSRKEFTQFMKELFKEEAEQAAAPAASDNEIKEAPELVDTRGPETPSATPSPRTPSLRTPPPRTPPPGPEPQPPADPGPGPTVPGLRPGGQKSDWDEDEPSTDRFAKQQAALLAKQAIAAERGGGRVTPISVKESSGQVSRPIPVTVESTPRPASLLDARPLFGRRPFLIGLGTAAALIVAVVVLTSVFVSTSNTQGRLMLRVVPVDNLRVILDGTEDLGQHQSPYDLPVSAGSHTVTIQRRGYKSYEFEVSVENGQTVEQNVALQPMKTGFSVETVPPGAEVWVDGRKREEKTPIVIEDLNPGEHTVQLALGKGYSPIEFNVETFEGKIVPVGTKRFDSEAVEITFQSAPPGATVTLVTKNGERTLGETPTTKPVPADRDAKLKVRYSKDGYRSETRPLTLPEGKLQATLDTVVLRPQAAPPKPVEYGMLSINSTPWSKVFIDGQPYGNTPLRQERLKAGTYTITLENPTFSAKKTIRATVQANKETKKIINLMK